MTTQVFDVGGRQSTPPVPPSSSALAVNTEQRIAEKQAMHIAIFFMNLFF
jgi:hypothetical protein